MFSAHCFFPLEAVEFEGENKVFSRLGGSGKHVHFRFCPNCGSTVYWDAEARPGLWIIAAGAFRENDIPAPSAAVWMEHKPEWMTLDESIPAFPRAGVWKSPDAEAE